MSGIMLALVAAAASAAMSVTASPPALITGAGSGSSFTTPSVSTIISGGTGSPSYVWVILASDGIHGFSITTSTASATTVHITGIVAGDTCAATLRCTVTRGAATAYVDVPIEHTDSRTPA